MILTIFVTFLSSCRQEVVILYGQTFEQIRDSAQKTDANFCVVLSSPDCPPCKTFIENVGHSTQNGMFRNTLFNIVDVSRPENKWYTQWICSGAMPTTCIFTSGGKLKAVVAGAASPSLQCIQSALNGRTLCTSYFYDRNYPVTNGSHLSLLNNLLACKLDLDKGVDVGEALNGYLEQTNYPWPVYLKCLNEEKQGRHDEAAYWAQQLLMFDDIFYYYIYGDLHIQAKFIIDPNYMPEEDAALSVVSEVRLEDCKVGQPKLFTLTLSNTGKVQLQIRDIRVSCTCLKLFESNQLVLEPGESQTVDFEFTAEETGEVYREVIFVSNGIDAIKQVKIEAHAQ